MNQGKQELKKFHLEYEVFPMRAIWSETVEAFSQEQALQKFWEKHPEGVVRTINGVTQNRYLSKS